MILSPPRIGSHAGVSDLQVNESVESTSLERVGDCGERPRPGDQETDVANPG